MTWIIRLTLHLTNKDQTGLVYRKLQDGSAEFLYLTDNVALFRQGKFRTNDYAIGFASWSTGPNYVWETGDRVSQVLGDKISRIGFHRAKGVIYGIGLNQRKLEDSAQSGLTEEYFIIKSNQIIWFNSKMDFDRFLREDLHMDSAPFEPVDRFMHNHAEP